jgi:high-affinity iron transporter
MTISAVIIILREVLEAALLVSLLLCSSLVTGIPRRGIIIGIVLGVIGAALVTWQFDLISESFEGVGQEVFNASLLGSMVLLLLAYSGYMVKGVARQYPGISAPVVIACLVVAMAITREGVEVFVFTYGFNESPAELLSVLVGGAMGAGIGISLGVLIYYALINLPERLSVSVPQLLFALLAAGMSSQAVVYLAQGGVIDSRLPVWDTSDWIPETSVTGQLLYVLLGYEATPAAPQLVLYGMTLLLFVAVALIAHRRHATCTGARAD